MKLSVRLWYERWVYFFSNPVKATIPRQKDILWHQCKHPTIINKRCTICYTRMADVGVWSEPKNWSIGKPEQG